MMSQEVDKTFKFRSESADIKASRNSGHSTSQSSLPRGEYLQPASSRSSMSHVKLKPLDYKKGNDTDDSFDGSLSGLDQKEKASSTSDSSAPSSEENTPTSTSRTPSKKPSMFSKRKIIDVDGVMKGTKSTTLAEESPVESFDNFYTPKMTKKKGNLYKLSIMQNAAKCTTEGSQPSTVTNAKFEERKVEVTRKLLEEHKEETKSANLLKTSGSFQQKDVVEKAKEDATLALKSLVFGPKVDDKILKKHLMLILRGLNYSLKLLKAPPMSYIQSRQIMLKELKKKNTKTLLLDLDETLITSCTIRDDPEKILTPADGGPPIMIKIRPFAREFLKKMKEHFEIIVFTASINSYAETIVKELDPEKKFISYILDRNFCLETKNGFYIKDLRIIKNRDLKNLVLVDNLVHSFGFQIENGIPIIEWTGNKADVELKYLMDYLLEAKKYEDMRDFNRQKLRLVEICNSTIEEIMDV